MKNEKMIIAPDISDIDTLNKGNNFLKNNERNQNILDFQLQETELLIKNGEERILKQKEIIKKLKEVTGIQNESYKTELQQEENLLQNFENELRNEIKFKNKIIKFLSIDILDNVKVSIVLEETKKEIAKFRENLLNGTPDPNEILLGVKDFKNN